MQTTSFKTSRKVWKHPVVDTLRQWLPLLSFLTNADASAVGYHAAFTVAHDKVTQGSPRYRLMGFAYLEQVLSAMPSRGEKQECAVC